ncbi:MAG: enoyl-CoA hydratase/isomerase family protein [bacterium]|nr:enoyl-CoA hydratase/isomerase family protein [bacterium]
MTGGRNRSGERLGRHSEVAEFLMSSEPRRNAVDHAFLDELGRAIDDAEDRDCTALVLRSALPRVFCSGADLTLPDAERADVSDRLYATYQRMLGSPVIFVADVAGAAVGGGAQLCLAADICMVTPDAWFRFAGAGHGLAVAAWGLVNAVGRHAAADMCLTMRKVDAAEAVRLGLATPWRDDLTAEIARTDPAARRRLKQLLNAAVREPLERERTGNRENWTGSIEGLHRWGRAK